MAMIQCPKCGEWISDQSGQCIQCGYVLPTQMNDQKKCPKCGGEIQEGMRFCSRCGCPLLAPNYPNGDDQPQQPVPHSISSRFPRSISSKFHCRLNSQKESLRRNIL